MASYKQGERSPYNLEVVPSSAVTREDYYTLGLSGVTHFANGTAMRGALRGWVLGLQETRGQEWRGGH